jgi:Uncharacterized conserved protein
MDAYRIIYELVICTAATVFFSLLMYAPPKTLPASALLGGVSWILYRLIVTSGRTQFLAYFMATLLVAVVSEILARIYKMPATIFIFPSVISLVPGTGLYQAMLSLVEEDYVTLRDVATQTLFAFCAITVAIALTGVVARSLSAYFHTRAQKRRLKRMKKEPADEK